MAFEPKNNTKNKNQFVARLVSRKTARTVSWINLTDEFSRSVLGVELKLVTAEKAQEVLPRLFGNDFLEVVITDLTKELEIVEPSEF